MSKHPDPNVNIDYRQYGDQGEIATVTVDYPTRVNVLNTPMMLLLKDAFHQVINHQNIRCVVLTGAGDRAFIGGADIKEFALLDQTGAETFITHVHGICQTIRDCPVPVIARINGYCLGAGMEVAAACDLRVASTGAMFGMPEVQVGVPSVVEAALLPRLMGTGKAAELVLTGELISAEDAHRFGFLEKIAPAHRLDTHLQEWLDSILSAAPNAVRLQKELLRKWEQLPLDQAIQAGITSFGEAFTTGEPKKYSAPFLGGGK
jgi:enoyl-CoA hydratase/carnithine racemase